MSANVSFGSSDEAAIKNVMAAYNDALNGGETAAVLPLYTEDGVFMRPYSQSDVGKEAVMKAYDAVFAAQIQCGIQNRRAGGNGTDMGLCPHELSGHYRPPFYK
jgi:ketosteroid isomerase-like protein